MASGLYFTDLMLNCHQSVEFVVAKEALMPSISRVIRPKAATFMQNLGGRTQTGTCSCIPSFGVSKQSLLLRKKISHIGIIPTKANYSSTEIPLPAAAVAPPSPPYYYLMVPPSVIAADHNNINKANEEEVKEEDYYHFLGLIKNKKISLVVKRAKKNLNLPWQREVFSTPDDSICVGSSHGWLAYVDPRNCAFYLFNPFFIHDDGNPLSSFIPLPPIESLPSILALVTHKSFSSPSTSQNSNNNNSSSVSLTTNFIVSRYPNHDQGNDPHFLSRYIIKRVACSSSPFLVMMRDNNNNYDDDDGNDCYAMIIQGPDRQLAFCKLWDNNYKGWTELDGPMKTPLGYEVIMYSNRDQVFYALLHFDNPPSMEAWDFSHFPSSPPKPTLIEPTFFCPQDDPYNRYRDIRYLVESTEGDLLLVVRYNAKTNANGEEEEEEEEEEAEAENDFSLRQERFYACYTKEEDIYHDDHDEVYYKTRGFDVYKLDLCLNEWVHVDCLGNQALFVGKNHSFSLSVGDFPELTVNSIYFTDSWRSLEQGKGHDSGVYNLENKLVTPILASTSPDKRIHPPPIWLGDPSSLGSASSAR